MCFRYTLLNGYLEPFQLPGTSLKIGSSAELIWTCLSSLLHIKKQFWAEPQVGSSTQYWDHQAILLHLILYNVWCYVTHLAMQLVMQLIVTTQGYFLAWTGDQLVGGSWRFSCTPYTVFYVKFILHWNYSTHFTSLIHN